MTYDDTVWNLDFLSDANHTIQEFNKSHIDMLIPINLVYLGHHSQVILATDLSRSKILG